MSYLSNQCGVVVNHPVEDQNECVTNLANREVVSLKLNEKQLSIIVDRGAGRTPANFKGQL